MQSGKKSRDLRPLETSRDLRHHAFAIEQEEEKGIAVARTWAERELHMHGENNPDIVVLRYGLLSVEDARTIAEKTAGAPFVGDHKVVIITAHRAYHEAQNVLLKLFEEPPHEAYLFLILSSLGGLLPTLRSRVQVLPADEGFTKPIISEVAEQFLRAGKDKRSAMIKKLTSGRDEEERREGREEAIAIINGIEAAAYATERRDDSIVALLSDISLLRSHLYERSAPVRMILEHLSLVVPRGLV